MTTLQEKIDALPEWPAKPTFRGMRTQEAIDAHCRYHAGRADAALARLALAREWIEGTNHDYTCDLIGAYGLDEREIVCTCGRDALLKALEAP